MMAPIMSRCSQSRRKHRRGAATRWTGMRQRLRLSRPIRRRASNPRASCRPSSPPRARLCRRSAPRTAADPERVIALNVMAADGERFGGVAIAAAAQRAGLELGTWSIYHYYSGEMPEAPPLFSVANMVKPGSFDLDQLHEISTVGLSLFMVPAGDEQDTQSLDIMLETARQLASELGGDVRDARRSVLTRQAIDRLREQLNEERFKARAARA